MIVDEKLLNECELLLANVQKRYDESGNEYLADYVVPVKSIDRLRTVVTAARDQVEDDARLVDEEWLRSMGFHDDSMSRDQRRYEIISGVRIVSNACAGGWEPFLLWAGTGVCHEKKNVTRGDVRRLLAALGVNS